MSVAIGDHHQAPAHPTHLTEYASASPIAMVGRMYQNPHQPHEIWANFGWNQNGLPHFPPYHTALAPGVSEEQYNAIFDALQEVCVCVLLFAYARGVLLLRYGVLCHYVCAPRYVPWRSPERVPEPELCTQDMIEKGPTGLASPSCVLCAMLWCPCACGLACCYFHHLRQDYLARLAAIILHAGAGLEVPATPRAVYT